ncbi:MAG: hypothetical protein QOG53_3152 [Frankiales bacterium]|jgi:hypothetical protein|nr:hypothetical protein [Frankiales bacterium]
MPVLPRFDTPASLPELGEEDRASWSLTVAGIFAGLTPSFPQIYDPTVADTPVDASTVDVLWTAFPARLLREASSQTERWERADDRKEQDEYCEWVVERRPDNKITRVIFTTEVPEYFEQVAASNEELLLELYHSMIGPDVQRGDLFEGATYNPSNERNTTTAGRIAHLAHPNNTLGAAVDLVANATVPRERNGVAITTKQALANCAGLGDAFRNSDPQIAAVVNGAARAGNELTLQDPLGLYIDNIRTSDLTTPDDTPAASFWTVERGKPGHILRARFEVPEDRGYTVSDIQADGRPIEFGAQLADRLTIRITAVVKPAGHTPEVKQCDG